jgi:peptide/nickel transport system permease protein
MGRYMGRRLAQLVPSLVGISVVIFLLLHLIPGDVIDSMLGSDISLSPEARDSLRQILGLDQPLYAQYFTWIWDVLHGDLGRSLRSNQPVVSMLFQRLPVTFELAILSLTVSVAVSVPLGVVSAVRRNSWWDFSARFFALIGLSLPTFWLATIFILVASLYFHWLPAVLFVNFRDDPVQNLGQMLLPVVSLALPLMAITSRLTRSAMLEVIRQDYVRTARAKGLLERVVLYRHSLRNALIPVITIIAIQLGQLFGGAVVIEQIFGLPGVGLLLLNGISQRDYPVVQGGVIFLATVFLLLNLFIDLLYGYLDPRIHYG